MSKIKLTGESSGYVEISAGNAAGNNTLEAPTSGTRLVAHEGSQDVTLNGNLTVNGVVSYEDVTNIDSVGIMTARAGINVTGGNLTIDAFSDTANNYLSLRNGYVPSANGGMGLMSTDHSGSNADGVAIYGHDGISLYTAQTERLRVNASGTLIMAAGSNLQMASNGRIFVGDGGNATDPMFANVSDTNTGIAFPSADTMLFTTGGSERLRITSAGLVKIPSGKFVAGASDDLQIYHDGSWNYIQSHNSKNFVIQVNDNENAFVAVPNGEVQLYHNNVKKFETDTSGVAIHEDTDKVVRFTGSIGEIGNVTGFQASNTAGSALTDFGMRATTLRFATGSAERLRIASDGALFVGEYSGSGRFVLHNADQSGGADTTYSKDKGLYVRNDCGPTHVDLTGVDNFTAKIHNGAYAGSGVSDPQGSISKLLLHGVTYNGYNAYGAISLDVQGPNHGRGDLVFLNGGNNTSISERLRITGGGTVKINPAELQTTAGDKFAQIRGGGIINTKRLATGHFGNTAAYQPQQLGYIGDYMHYGCNALYYLAQTSTGNSGYSSHMFSWYDSGHWGHYGKFILMCHEVSYIGGMCHRYLSGTTVQDIFNIGNAGSVSTTSTTTGSGTHSGQSVTRYDCTVSHSGTYRTMRWYLGLFHGAQLGVTGSGKSQSDCNTYANSNGSLLHLFGVSDSNLTMAPNYRTW